MPVGRPQPPCASRLEVRHHPYPWLLSLAPLLLALAVSASLPALTAAVSVSRSLRFSAAGQSPVQCGTGGGGYAANSTYQANLHHLAALLPAEVSAIRGRGDYDAITRAVGYWPNRLLAKSYCRRRDGDGTYFSCAACITRAFVEVERACPYRRDATFSSSNCILEVGEIRIFGTGAGSFFRGGILKLALASGLVFQAIGFACLFFLQLQEWRSRRRGTLM